MAFPSNPSVGDTYDELNNTYRWNGAEWDRILVRPGNETLYRSGLSNSSVDLNDAAGYMYKDSTFYENGGTHAGNPDVLLDVAPNTLTTVKFSGQFTNASDGVPLSIYDTATGSLTLTGFTANQFIDILFNIDVDPDTDGGQAVVVLDGISNAATGQSPFQVEGVLLDMSQGAGTDYSGIVRFPMHIGVGLVDDGTPAVITPKIKLLNTAGDVKPRAMSLYLWN